MKTPTRIAVISALASCCIAAACGPSSPGASQTYPPLPTFVPDGQPTGARPALSIQYCDDDTGSYPRQYFGAANQLIASSLEDAVSANQGGVTLYATAITSNTFDPRNTLTPAFVIPAITAFQVPPTPIPTNAPIDPVTDPPTAAAIRTATTQGIIGYNQTATSIAQQVHSAKAHIARDVSRLTTWAPPIDASATSILGCLQLAGSRLQGQPGVKLLYIASDMENNTDVDYTQDLVTGKRLSGVIVHIIYFVSTDAARDQEKRAMWCPFLHAAGATSVRFSDPGGSQPLADVFDHDYPTQPQPC